jgi:hypothetical protein
VTPEETKAARDREWAHWFHHATENHPLLERAGWREYPCVPEAAYDWVFNLLDVATRQAAAEEREACAALCEKVRGDAVIPAAGALDCAKAIRARGRG